MTYLANITRSEGDPRILSTGRSSVSASDRLGRALGWLSLALGCAELLAPRRITRALGMAGTEPLVRAFGLREIGSGVVTLSIEREAGLWSRVAGDGLDLATLAIAYRANNPKRGNVGLATAMVVGITLLDFVAVQLDVRRHSRLQSQQRQYGDRSGFPQGVQRARGAARESAS